jgi:hypothetical protein
MRRTSLIATALAGLTAVAMTIPASAQTVNNAPGSQIYRLPGGGGGGGGIRPQGGRPNFGGGGFGNRGGFGGGPGRNFAGGSDWRGRGGYGGYRHHGGYGVGAGLAGLAAGAVIGGAIASQYPYNNGYYDGGYDTGYDPAYAAPPAVYADAPPVVAGGDDEAYCQQRYKSYDPSSGTYLGYDGLRHPCPAE